MAANYWQSRNKKGMPWGQLASHNVGAATTKIQTVVIMGNIGHSTLEVMLDFSSSIFLLAQSSVI